MLKRAFNDPLHATLLGRATFNGYKAIGESFVPITPAEREHIIKRLSYDEKNMVCTGCGSTKPMAYFQAIGAMTCCPARNMVATVDLLDDLAKARKDLQASQAHRGPTTFADDYLEGAGAIATFLGGAWNEAKVYHARSTRALPIRKLRGTLVYAFKSELEPAMRCSKSLPGQKSGPHT